MANTARQTVARFWSYPEALILIVTTSIMVWQHNASLLSLIVFAIISSLSVIVIAYSYVRKTNLYMSFIIMALLGALMSVLQFCLVISLCFLMLMGLRLIKSRSSDRLILALSAITSMIVTYLASLVFGFNTIQCDKQILPVTVLGMTVLTMLASYWQLYLQTLTYKTQGVLTNERLTTLVAVINKLTRFVPPQIWQPIVKTNHSVLVSSKRAKLTVMFSDIAGFTALSDTLSSDNLADILNTYMNSMTIIANRHGAVLDKFIGDGMLCFFGEPNSKGARADAIACVAMAIDMRREMRALRHQWRLLGFEGLYVRIGINTGYCHVGNFGSNNRMSYTLIGREANLASRLESAAGKGEILISQSTYDYICHEYECEVAGSHRLKGFDEPITCWKVLDPDANKGSLSKWVDHDLPGFNLHLNFKDIKNYDYRLIKHHLNQALERIEKEESKK